jgi:succinyl-diaminopimelate desuccinylase
MRYDADLRDDALGRRTAALSIRSSLWCHHWGCPFCTLQTHRRPIEAYHGKIHDASAEVHMTDPLTLACQLIELCTDPDNTPALAAALAIVAAELGGFTIEYFERAGAHSLLAYVGQTRPVRFGVLLNGHVDVIPGDPAHYHAHVAGDRLSGIGAVDMKANLAMLIDVFRRCAHQTKYPLGLQIVSDEEVGGFNGTLLQRESGVTADVVLSGESTGFDIVNRAKSISWYRCTIRGTTAHGAYPWQGTNALLLAQAFIDRLLTQFPTPTSNAWYTTVNVAGIDTHTFAFNKVPDTVTVSLDIRSTPGDHATLPMVLAALLPEGATIETVVDEPAMETSPDHAALTLLKITTEAVLGTPVTFRPAMGSSDARHYATTGAACIEFGPLGHGIATPDESTSIHGLGLYRTILERFLMDYSTNTESTLT